MKLKAAVCIAAAASAALLPGFANAKGCLKGAAADTVRGASLVTLG